MKIKMIALLTFRGLEGFIHEGETFEAEGSRRAEELEQHKLAAYYEEKAKDPGLRAIPLEETIKALNSHVKVDEFAAMNNLAIPGKDEAKLAERQAAVLKALTNAE